MRIVLTGGGTGGHLVPFEPIADALRTVHGEQKGTLPPWIDVSSLDVYFLGVTDTKTRDFFSRLSVITITIPSGKLRRYPSPYTVSDLLFRLPLGILKALFYMWRIMPDVVISKGGYGSLPVTFAALVYRIPILLHESDVVPGLATHVAARWATAITVGLEIVRDEMHHYKEKTIVTGTPVRDELTRFAAPEAKQAFGFSDSDFVVLVMGGSQGSEEINEVLLQALGKLVHTIGIIHLTGEEHYKKVSEVAAQLLATSSRRNFYKPFPYLTDKMALALAAADAVVARAGATTLAELVRLHKPAIIIPLGSAAHDHQRRNATIFEVRGAARVIDPTNLGPAIFERNILDIVESEEIRSTLSANIAQFDHPHAARDIALLAFKLASGLVPKELS